MQKRRNIRIYLRLLIFCFLLCYDNNYIYPLKSDSIEITIPNNVFHLDSFFYVEAKLNYGNDINTQLLTQGSDLSPKLVIDNECLEFIQTDISNIYQGILIKNIYRLKQHGIFLLQPKILYENNNIILDPVKIKIEPPVLSDNTKFKWFIFTEDNEKPKKTTTGKTYIIALAGFFYNENSDKQKYLQNMDIICQTPENAILELADITDDKFKKKLGIGWQCVKIFYWIPLKSGYQILPQTIINLNIKEANNKKSISIAQEKVFVEKSAPTFFKTNQQEKIKQKYSPAKIINKEKSLENFDKQKKITKELENKKLIAKKIAKLKNIEAKTFFNSHIKLERKKLEKDIGISSSFSTPSILAKYSSYLFLIALIIILICAYKISKQKKLISFFIFTSLIIFFGLIFYFNFISIRNSKLKVFIPEDVNSTFNIYHIPETTGMFAGELEIGETVLILYETHGWAKIKKYNGTIGWKKIWY